MRDEEAVTIFFQSELRRVARIADPEERTKGVMVLAGLLVGQNLTSLDPFDIMASCIPSIGSVTLIERTIQRSDETAVALFLTTLNEQMTLYSRVAHELLKDCPFSDAAMRWPNLVWRVE